MVDVISDSKWSYTNDDQIIGDYAFKAPPVNVMINLNPLLKKIS